MGKIKYLFLLCVYTLYLAFTISAADNIESVIAKYMVLAPDVFGTTLTDTVNILSEAEPQQKCYVDKGIQPSATPPHIFCEMENGQYSVRVLFKNQTAAEIIIEFAMRPTAEEIGQLFRQYADSNGKAKQYQKYCSSVFYANRKCTAAIVDDLLMFIGLTKNNKISVALTTDIDFFRFYSTHS